MGIEIRVLGGADASMLAQVAPDVFDDPLDPLRTKEFLADDRHHLIVALEGKTVVGFVSALHYVHPDKANPELWINEVGVAGPYQGQGIGKALMQSTLELGRHLGCKEAWVLTERSNKAAMKLYASSGGKVDDTVMVTFDLDAPKP
jgi:aminoglycoside 6'-N-acetyltransferase I